MFVHLCVPLKLTLYDARVSCVCCCLGAPLVSVRLAPRVDSACKPACEQCGRRLADCKGKLHKKDPGHICHRCYTKASRSPSSGSSTSTSLSSPMRSHKRRRANSDPGKQSCITTRSSVATMICNEKWDPTPEELATWKPDPQLAAAVQHRKQSGLHVLLLNGHADTI